MPSTTITEPAVAGLPDDKRAELVRRLTDDLMAAKLDAGTALLMLDCLGLTGDREALSHGMAARYMRDGLRDGSIDPYAVDPELKVGREAAIDLLAEQYDGEFETSIATLATVSPLPGQVKA